MVYRKGEFQLSKLDRFYPFHVAVLIHRDDQRERFDYFGELDAAYRAMGEAPRQRSIGRGPIRHHLRLKHGGGSAGLPSQVRRLQD
ncbi:hypothetical protein LMIY3S_00269 [Labrys miyagiensis]